MPARIVSRLMSARLEVVLLSVSTALAVLHHALAISDALRDGDAARLADAWIMAEQAIFHVPLILGVWAAVTGRVGFAALCVALVVGHWANEFKLLDGVLHGFLERNRLYPDAFYHGGSSVNVQYAIVLLYAALLPVLAFMTWRRRSIDRIFMLLILVTTLGTTGLFHKIIVQSALTSAIADIRNERLSAMKLSFGQPDQTFESICRGLAMTCFTLGNDERVPAAGSMGYGPGVHFALSRIHRDTAGRMVRHSEAMIVGVLAPDIRGEQFTYERLDHSSRARIMVDTGSYDRIVARHKPYFAILLIAAHLWWVLGGISLLHWHRRRLARRRAPAAV